MALFCHFSKAKSLNRRCPAGGPAFDDANEIMGRVLDESGRRQEARPYYATALQEALTVQPDFQSSEVAPLKALLAVP